MLIYKDIHNTASEKCRLQTTEVIWNCLILRQTYVIFKRPDISDCDVWGKIKKNFHDLSYTFLLFGIKTIKIVK